jgi:hypothetical protein
MADPEAAGANGTPVLRDRDPLLAAERITKRFGTFTANDGIDLDVVEKSTRCWAKTAPGNRPSSRSSTGCCSRPAGACT